VVQALEAYTLLSSTTLTNAPGRIVRWTIFNKRKEKRIENKKIKNEHEVRALVAMNAESD